MGVVGGVVEVTHILSVFQLAYVRYAFSSSRDCCPCTVGIAVTKSNDVVGQHIKDIL